MQQSTTIAQTAAAFMREHGHQSVMWGDVHLLHEIAEAAGMEHNAGQTERAVLNALDRSSEFVKLYVKLGAGQGRIVRAFYLPEHAPKDPPAAPPSPRRRSRRRRGQHR